MLHEMVYLIGFVSVLTCGIVGACWLSLAMLRASAWGAVAVFERGAGLTSNIVWMQRWRAAATVPGCG